MSKTLKTLVAAAALAAATFASATPIVGSAQLSLGLVSVSLNEIDWNPPLNPGLDVVPTYGTFTTVAPGFGNTGVFDQAPFSSGSGFTQGSLQDMSNNPLDANYAPVGVLATPQANFVKFNAQPNWLFSLTYVTPGSGPFPYLLTQQGSAVQASIVVGGVACDDTNANGTCDLGEDKTNWTGSFNSRYLNTNVQALVDDLTFQNGGDGMLTNNSWSGTIEATALPEPATLGLVGLALAGLGFAGRRRQAK